MDYRKLLIWYINHVGEQEGTDFLGDFHKPDFGKNDVGINEEEWAELQRLTTAILDDTDTVND